MQTIKSNEIKKGARKRYLYYFIIVLGFFIASSLSLYFGSAPSTTQLKEGDIFPRTIYAPYEFSYPTGIDTENTEVMRKQAEAKVPPVYDIDSSVQTEAFAKLDGFFDAVQELEKNSPLESSQNDEVSKFAELKQSNRMRKISKDVLENVFLVGIVPEEEKTKLIKEKVGDISIRNQEFKIERTVNSKDLIDAKEANKIINDTILRMIPKDKKARKLVYELIKDDVKTNLSFSAKETDRRKEKARSELLPIYRKSIVKKSELIIEKGKKLTALDIAKLTQITRVQKSGNRSSYLLGLFIVLSGLALITVGYLTLFNKKLMRLPKNALLIAINAFLAIFGSLVLIHMQAPVYIIPLAAIGMILVLLMNTNSAFIVSLSLSIFIGFMAGGKIELTLMLFAGTAVGIYVVRGARKRSQIFFAGFAVALANIISILGIGLFSNMVKESIFRDSLYGVAGGIISSFIVIGLLPLFEYLFNLVTNITLLELSDLSNPLLKKLTIQAPGTYHHSILVGNLAEEACNSIGANSLLARVGSYYHDIGKIEKSEYFVENEGQSSSRHEKLAPSMSALIITNHTKDGVDLAKKYNINSAVIDFITQHHGTSLIYYFYQRALEKAKSEEELKEEEFRYPGPKPQTKETAIVHLADSVEASSRMLSDPTPARIRTLVQKIINNKFIDGQLDECDLTLKDLNKISESFVRVLTGVFHTRIEYPEATTKKERKNAAKIKDKQSK